MFGLFTCYADSTPQEALQETFNILNASQSNVVSEIIKSIAIIAVIVAIVLLLYRDAKNTKNTKKEKAEELSSVEAAVLGAKLNIARKIAKARREAVEKMYKKK